MPDDDIQIRILQLSLDSVRDIPAPLEEELRHFSKRYPGTILTVAQLIGRACSTNANDPLKLALHKAFMHWDYVRDAPWTDPTEPNTPERRHKTYEYLGLGAAQAADLDRAIPLFVAEHATVIAETHRLWYADGRARGGFYWPAYRKYLELHSGWKEDALLSLDESTRSVTARLSDPAAPEIYQSKGLVVGYVQSGKTANFTGVVARAADAGYRLIIILTGTTEILRRQTQRRLDKEMIGRELLGDDYNGEADLNSFLAHQALPSQLGAFDWQRLTGPQYDYKSLKRGIDALEFEKVDRDRPFYDVTNLRNAKARLVVIKKNSAILKSVTKDLKRIRSRLEEIPALIIDDESDQASVNTLKPQEAKKRSTINGLIVELIRALPRSQYVGYLNVLLGTIAAKEVVVGKSLEPGRFPDRERSALRRIVVNVVVPVLCNVTHNGRAGLISQLYPKSV
jgi:hypothetical protein